MSFALRNYLGQIDEMYRETAKAKSQPMPERKYLTYEGLVLDQGEWWPQTQIIVAKLGPDKECFSNAMREALDNPGWSYVEGYADSGILPVNHAWCLDDGGKPVEVTWDTAGVEYLGLVYQPEKALAIMARTGYYGLIGNDWLDNLTLLTGGIE